MHFDEKTIRQLKAQLEEIGYANDEQFLGSAAFEHHHDEIVADLAQLGYEKLLLTSGDFYQESGALYWKYDPEMVSPLEAQFKSDSWVATRQFNR